MSGVIGAPTRFTDALRRPDARGREVETAMAIHLEPFVVRNHLHVDDILRALTGNAVAILLAKSQSYDDAVEGARLVADEIVRRITEASRR